MRWGVVANSTKHYHEVIIHHADGAAVITKYTMELFPK